MLDIEGHDNVGEDLDELEGSGWVFRRRGVPGGRLSHHRGSKTLHIARNITWSGVSSNSRSTEPRSGAAAVS